MAALTAAGLTDIDITETHRVHEHAGSAIVRARKPGADCCCRLSVQAACCEPAAKDECCGAEATADGGCGCG